MLIDRILVAHDFSEAASRALRFAAELSARTDAELALAYVLPDLQGGRGDQAAVPPAATPEQGERYLRFLEEELAGIASAQLGEGAQPVRCHVLRGDPVKQLEAAAQQLGATLICLGATGKGAVERTLLGSVSQLMIRSSAVPVLIVP